MRTCIGGGQQASAAACDGAGLLGRAVLRRLYGPMAAAAAAVGKPVEPAVETRGERIALTLNGRAPVTLHYEEEGSGPPLLLVHGLGESSFTWHDVVPALAARFRVIALDLKGFGRSDKPEDDAYGADDQAALIANFIVSRGLENVTLVGHSFGGTVALRTALADSLARNGPHRADRGHRRARIASIDRALPRPREDARHPRHARSRLGPRNTARVSC